MKALRIVFVGGYFCAAMLPLIWLLLTSFKTRDDSIAVHPKFVPTWAEEVAADGIYFRANLDGYRQLAAVYAGGDHAFFHYLGNSLVIGLLSTLCSAASASSASPLALVPSRAAPKWRTAAANSSLYTGTFQKSCK